MSALTFKDLSTELTQAIETQLDIPSGTKARCTLGREKVMVLVEYPSQSDRDHLTEPPTDSTLDWLEQSLRTQFDTVGLPEEAADLTETGEAVAVQLFLKHLSDPKPFTARSFVWKVADGFDDLFGDPHSQSEASDDEELDSTSEELDSASEESDSASRQSDRDPIFQDETGSLSSPEVSTDIDTIITLDSVNLDSTNQEEFVEPDELAEQYSPDLDLINLKANSGLEDLTEESADLVSVTPAVTLEKDSTVVDHLAGHLVGHSAIDASEDNSLAELESASEVETEDNLEAEFFPLSAIDESDTEGFSLPGEAPAIPTDSAELELPTVDLPFSHSEEAAPSDEGFFDMPLEQNYNPSAATDSELAADFESALDNSPASLSGYETNEEIELNEDIFDELLIPDELASENITEENNQYSDIESQQSTPTETAGLRQTEQASLDGITLGADSPGTQLVGGISTATVGRKADSASPIGSNQGSESNEHTADEPIDSDRSTNIRLNGNQGDRITPDGSRASDYANIRADIRDELEPGEEIFNISEEEDWQADADLELDGEADDRPVETENTAISNAGFDEYGSDEYLSSDYDAGDYDAGDYDAGDRDEDTENNDAAHAELYQLEQSAGDADYEDDVALVDEGEVQAQREQWQQQTKGNPWFFVGAASFFAIGLLGFILTRPCSFGACPRIETAQAEGERALSNLTLGADLKAVTAAKEQLNSSVQSLQPIPFWSPHHSKAQAVLPEFENQLLALDRVTTAQEQAYQAALASQNPPHSSAKWEAIAEQWRSAIATLESVPTNNSVRRLANKKLTEYRANLSTVKVRIDAEAKAEENLSGAQQAATIATATAKQADALEDWESALENWELAVDRIDRIPQGTLAYKEAQALQIDYRKEMELVRDRTLQERNANENLSKAEQLASDAKRVESEDQWTVAVQTWKAAIREIEELAQGTTAYAAAQPLASRYKQSLEKAESNRQVSLRFQPVEPSFYAACGATATQKCTYSVSSGNVRLNLLQDYDRAINQSITPPDQRNEVDIDSGVVTQSNQLLKDITLLSTQAQVPIELYDAQGEFLARYRPDLNGFVKDRET